MDVKECIGIEIGGTKLQIAAGDSDGTILKNISFQVAREDGAAGILRNIESAVKELKNEFSPAAIGAGFGGPIDAFNGVVKRSNQIGGWSSFPLKDWLEASFGLPAVVDNDANTACLAEARAGAGQSHRAVFYVTLGSGCGGGLSIDGKIYHGAAPGESEIGMLKLSPHDSRTIEELCSGWSVDRQIRLAASENPGGIIAHLARGMNGGEARCLPNAIEQGDKIAASILDSLAENLAFGLSHVVHLLNPDIIVIGGGLSLMGDCLLKRIAEAIAPRINESFLPGPEIATAKFGKNVVCTGALIMAGEL